MNHSLSMAIVLAVSSCLASPGLTAQSVSNDRFVHLRFASFDPAVTTPAVPELLRSNGDERLFIAQFDGLPTEARRAELRRRGAEIHGYLPENSYVVRMDAVRRNLVRTTPGVRSLTPYHPAFRLEPELIAEALNGTEMPRRRYNIVVVDKRRDKPGLIRDLVRIGGVIEHEQTGSILLEASLTRAQLLVAARFDEVLWIDRWTAPELDMDNARIQGGANHVETNGQYTGQGIRGHVYEGVERTHQDFKTPATNVRSSGAAQSHGHCTAGIVFGSGASNAAARGMAPDALAFYTTYTSVQGSRWQVVEDLVKIHKVMFTTASWGGNRTRAYTSTSASTDDIIFDHDMVWTNSQSNAGNQDSRPEAWAKNIISCGGVRHGNNSNPADDRWSRGGSTGPAADGRIKPDLCAYYDGILCSDRTGSAGYNRSGNFYTSFGGTSGATPIIAGHNAIAIQMFTDGLFSPKRKANGTRFENKPHFTTLKALQIANAAQYTFTSTSTDNRREHCGWGFPDLKTMYDRRNLHYVVDETDILTQGKGFSYRIRVPANQPELKVSMCFADLPANPSASLTRINDLTLRVTAPNGTTRYWGNAGLATGNYSVTGGSNDIRDTVENVFVKDPAPGLWTIEVAAYLVAQDSHIETSAVDADFGLVSVGGTFISKQSIDIPVGSFAKFGTGCPSSVACVTCYSENWTKTSANTRTTATRIALLEARPQFDTVCGADFYMGAPSSTPVDVTIGVWDTDTLLNPRNRLTSATVRVSQLGEYSVTFPTTPRLDIYYLIIESSDKIILPVSTTGQPVLHRELRNNTWSDYLYTTNWQYRVSCNKGAAVPALDLNGSPVIGELVNFELSSAAPSTAAIFLLGASDSTWSGLNLPWNYAANCNLLVSGEIILGTVSDSSGNASVPLQIPNDKLLVGAQTYQQFLVLDSGNSFGLISSNAGRKKLGEF